jgi:ABC-type lipoprotein export system ATPase subunit
MLNDYALKLTNVSKKFTQSNHELYIFDSVNLELEASHYYILRGESGSGKSTLFNMIAGFIQPDTGSIHVFGQDIQSLKGNDKSRYLSETIGIIYQDYHLQKHLSVYDNLASIMRFQGKTKQEYHDRVNDLINKVGLLGYVNHKPFQLSGGQQQRVAIARSLLNNPQLLLADEPTGNLDPENARNIINLLHSLQKEFSTTVITITHDNSLTLTDDRVYSIHNKTIVPV